MVIMMTKVIMITIIRSSEEETGGTQMKKTLVFHSLAPEKNETGERLDLEE